MTRFLKKRADSGAILLPKPRKGQMEMDLLVSTREQKNRGIF